MSFRLKDRGRSLTRDARNARKTVGGKPVATEAPDASQNAVGRQIEYPLEQAEGVASGRNVQEMHAAESARDLLTIFEKQHPPEHELLTLHYIEGLTIEQIATKLGKPIGTIKKNANLARQLFRRLALESGTVGESVRRTPVEPPDF